MDYCKGQDLFKLTLQTLPWDVDLIERIRISMEAEEKAMLEEEEDVLNGDDTSDGNSEIIADILLLANIAQIVMKRKEEEVM